MAEPVRDFNTKPIRRDREIGIEPIEQPHPNAVDEKLLPMSNGEITPGHVDEFVERGSELMKPVSGVSTESDIVYPTGFRLVVIIVSLCFAVFLVALDQTIIATAMYPPPLWKIFLL